MIKWNWRGQMESNGTLIYISETALNKKITLDERNSCL